MLVACWSVKGGVGTSVVAASLALLLARDAAPGAVLADLAGDAPAVLGLPEPAGPGVAGLIDAWPGGRTERPGRARGEAAPGRGERAP
nr:hypothetical protein [Thermoanaerobacterales bacterium]